MGLARGVIDRFETGKNGPVPLRPDRERTVKRRNLGTFDFGDHGRPGRGSQSLADAAVRRELANRVPGRHYDPHPGRVRACPRTHLEAEQELERFSSKWDGKYSIISKQWCLKQSPRDQRCCQNSVPIFGVLSNWRRSSSRGNRCGRCCLNRFESRRC
jgi:hypothetical protein